MRAPALVLPIVALAGLPFTRSPRRSPPPRRRSTPPSAATGRCTTPTPAARTTPGQVNVARFVVFLAHTFSETAGLPVGARGRGCQGRGRRARRRSRAGADLPGLHLLARRHAARGPGAAPGRHHQRDPRAAHVQRRRAPRLRSRRHPEHLAGHRRRPRGRRARVLRAELPGLPAQRAGRQRLLRRRRHPRGTAGGQGGELREPVAHRPSRVGRPGASSRRLVLVRGQRRAGSRCWAAAASTTPSPWSRPTRDTMPAPLCSGASWPT